MIYIQDKYLKVAGKYIPGVVETVDVREEGIIEDKKDSKGKVLKANVPQGYQAATVDIQMKFEESGSYDRVEMVKYVQRLFRTTNQKTQKKYRITESQCTARGITEVYFNAFTTSEIVGESYFRGTLTFVAPVVSSIKVTKTKKKKAAATAKKKAAKKKAAAAAAKKKSFKSTSKSPAKQTVSTKNSVAKAKVLVKTINKNAGGMKRVEK